jgi:hypothetical protein
VDVVELNILAGGDMGDIVGVLFGEVGESFELSGVEAAEGDLDALHAGRIPHGVGAFGVRRGVGEGAGGGAVVALAVVITLAVSAAAEAGFSKDAVLNLALFFEGDLAVEDVEFGGELRGHAVGESRFPLGIA